MKIFVTFSALARFLPGWPAAEFCAEKTPQTAELQRNWHKSRVLPSREEPIVCDAPARSYDCERPIIRDERHDLDESEIR